MLQIKTIVEEKTAPFDTAVNEAIADGWTLTKRTLIGINGYLPMLYAELEREEITEAERACENCKHCDLDPNAEPCRNCEDGPNNYPTKWEAIEE